MSQPISTYTFKPLDHERATFRQVLLHKGTGSCIECTLIDASFDESDLVPYEAVSYTWGSAEKKERVMILGQVLTITANLYSALCALRQPDADRLLWIDSICINQDSDGEKTHQVSQMAEIYKRAERVLIYLGEESQDTDILMESLKRFEKSTVGYHWDISDDNWKYKWQIVQNDMIGSQDNTITTHIGLAARQRQGLYELLARRWFHRVWVLQEVANARTAWVYCGRSCVSTRVFCVAHRLLGVKAGERCEAVIDLMPGPSRKSSWDEGIDFVTLLHMFQNHEASHQHDRIYALRGISIGGKKNDGLCVDYTKSLEEVILDTIRFMYLLPQSLFTQSPYKTIDQFFQDLHKLRKRVLRQLVDDANITSITHFVQLQKHELAITRHVLRKASKNEVQGEDMMSILLQHLGNRRSVITSDVFKAAAKNRTSGEQIIRLLFQHLNKHHSYARQFGKRHDVITPDAIKVAAQNKTSGDRIVQLLLQHLSKRHDSPRLGKRSYIITSDVLKAAAKNKSCGEGIIHLLLQHVS